MSIISQKPSGCVLRKCHTGIQGSLIRLGWLARDPQGLPVCTPTSMPDPSPWRPEPWPCHFAFVIAIVNDTVPQVRSVGCRRLRKNSVPHRVPPWPSLITLSPSVPCLTPPGEHRRLPRLPTGSPGQRAQPQRTGIPLALPPWLGAVLNFVAQPRRGFSPRDCPVH